MKKLRRHALVYSVIAGAFALLVVRFDLLATGENIYEQIQRFTEVVQAVQKFYFEDVDSNKLIDGAINGMLEELDPHSIYISKDRIQEINEQFEGEFEGIGIEFIIHDKLPLIVTPMANSPSESLGLRSGDRITKIDGKSTYGYNEDKVRQGLLGKKGTKVTIEIQRPGFSDPFEVTITRDKIPIYSVTSSFMLDEKTGYIRVGRFARTTGSEFESALNLLQNEGMQKLILDLRGNSGGYLEQAVEMADKFLEGEKRIVYTRGRLPEANEDYYSTTRTAYANLPLIIMINHGSASASEIVAGALQDWDRGLVVGETSFGKGLVQNQFSLKNGSAVRVTIARYYTPSGRLIQRSYENGLSEYVAEGYDDIDPNASEKPNLNKPKFETSSGRIVYGGGGITPDVEIKSKQISSATVKLIQKRIFFDFATEYTVAHRGTFSDFNTFKKEFKIEKAMVDDLINMARKKNITISDEEVAKDFDFISRRIKSQIARHRWSSGEYEEIEIVEDIQVREALKYFSEAAKIADLRLEM